MLILQNLGYIHSNNELLFDNINITIEKGDKVALVGNNGAGKSTLLKIIACILEPSFGSITRTEVPYYVPQLFGQFNDLTVAQALQIEGKLKALKAILNGQVTEENLTLLNDDWTIEERCNEALIYWGLENLDLTKKMENLSSGQKTKVFLAGISIHQPETILLDEPSNHLDLAGRNLLYQFIQANTSTMVVVSHDRKLLNMLHSVCELSKRGIIVYGGNYEFYATQKKLELNALDEDVRNKEKALRKAKEVERETAERQQKLDARGKRKQEKAGLPTISMNTLRNNAEKSTAKLKGIHADKVESIFQELSDLRKELPDMDKIKFGFDNSTLHKGKVLINAEPINYEYGAGQLWKETLSFQIQTGERVALKGINGSGKTTLIKILLGDLEPKTGFIYRAEQSAVYVDQEYSLIDNNLKVYEQAQKFNSKALQEHEVKIRLTWFLFDKNDWDKPCSALSGGEKMRLILCCLTISNEAPDMIILDEPTNNLDIKNIEILTHAIKDYQGTLIVVSHDEYFLKEIDVNRNIELT